MKSLFTDTYIDLRNLYYFLDSVSPPIKWGNNLSYAFYGLNEIMLKKAHKALSCVWLSGCLLWGAHTGISSEEKRLRK